MTRFLLFLFFLLALAACDGKVFNEDFDNPPLEEDWQFEAYEGSSEIPELYLEQAGGYEGIAVAREGMLVSPRFAVEPHQWYRLSFLTESLDKAMWGVRFYDEAGELLPADHYSSIDPAIDFQPRAYYFKAKADAADAAFVLHPQQGQEVLMNQLIIEEAESKEEILQWQQGILQSVPSVDFSPPDHRFEHLEASLQKLRSGEQLRVVMLGNSIMNDIGNAGWELQVEQLYPGSELQVITSVKGGKGAPYYRQDNRVENFVVRYDPDLVMIGGISHENDTAAIHDVIKQIRKQMEPDPEIMLLSGPLGRDGDPRRNPDFSVQPQPEDFRTQLAELARRTNSNYFDLKTTWAEYLASTNASYDYFLRDELHANARGRQVLARLMALYFSPQKSSSATE